LYPDFMTQGIADVSNYNDGMRGGRTCVRAKISQLIKTLWWLPDRFRLILRPWLIVFWKPMKRVNQNKKNRRQYRCWCGDTWFIYIQVYHQIKPLMPYCFTRDICSHRLCYWRQKPLFVGVSYVANFDSQNARFIASELEIQLEELK
jgi:topoisomerase-4 subunit A